MIGVEAGVDEKDDEKGEVLNCCMKVSSVVPADLQSAGERIPGISNPHLENFRIANPKEQDDEDFRFLKAMYESN